MFIKKRGVVLWPHDSRRTACRQIPDTVYPRTWKFVRGYGQTASADTFDCQNRYS